MSSQSDAFPYTIRRLAQPTDAQIEEATQVFVKAFADDRHFVIAVGEALAKKIRVPFQRSYILTAALGGELYVAEDADARIVGVCTWFGPGHEMYDSEEQRKKVLEPLMAMYTPEFIDWSEKHTKFAAQAVGAGTTVREWYLQRIGVLPGHQGQGIATALIEEVRSKISGHSIALEATRQENVDFYEYLGFKLKGHTVFRALYGELPLNIMLWQPSGRLLS